MRENVWLSRTVQVEDEQEVITTGLYGIVRHPMYTATLLMFLAKPLVLGSWWAGLIFALYIPVIVRRILDEEKLLRAELKGYNDYCLKLRWRLIPYIW
jgi:protein-S-isoprenylcysteine O-methyltransferase Ste14